MPGARLDQHLLLSLPDGCVRGIVLSAGCRTLRPPQSPVLPGSARVLRETLGITVGPDPPGGQAAPREVGSVLEQGLTYPVRIPSASLSSQYLADAVGIRPPLLDGLLDTPQCGFVVA